MKPENSKKVDSTDREVLITVAVIIEKDHKVGPLNFLTSSRKVKPRFHREVICPYSS